MPRYFLEVAYKGTVYSGFQTQINANTVQAEIEKAFLTLLREPLVLTGSSRTDAGVHALQNFFHFDSEMPVGQWKGITGEAQLVYKMNAILPGDIVIKHVFPVPDTAHSRFDATDRTYHYYIYRQKDPFLRDRAFYFPYKLDMEKMQSAAAMLMSYTDFTSFSKRNTQAKTFICQVAESEWREENGQVIYRVRANRFLRGMVRALTATMLKIGRGKLSLDEFAEIIEAHDCTKASFAVPAHGLFLIAVAYK
jgi:tRNA pseudouridine38-40 synthase